MKQFGNKYKKELGNKGEEIVADYYESNGFFIVSRNYIVKGVGELDIVAENDQKLSFIEVKSVDNIDDLMDYISKRKISRIKKTMQHFLMENPTEKNIQIDIVFVKNKKIFEIYENIEF